MVPNAQPSLLAGAHLKAKPYHRRALLRHPHNRGIVQPHSQITWEESELILEPSEDWFSIGQTQSDPPTHESIRLGQRFAALPAELRAEIFSHLIVRASKWDARHRPDCGIPGKPYNSDVYATSIRPARFSCASCTHYNLPVSSWRHLNLSLEDRNTFAFHDYHQRDWTRGWFCNYQGHDIWIDPWRSKWAPPQLNPYLCTDCYDDEMRSRPHPRPKAVAGALPCLCARRDDLQIMLVCRQWYEEAATVFYTRNTFAFEDEGLFVDFVATLQPRWADKISKISIMEPSVISPSSLSPDLTLPPLAPGAEQLEYFVCPISSRVIRLLRQLPALSLLELPSLCLTTANGLINIRRLGHSNLRLVKFVDIAPCYAEQQSWAKTWWWKRFKDPEIYKAYMWPHLSQRQVVAGGTAEKFARAAKCQPQFRQVKGRRAYAFWANVAREERLAFLERRTSKVKCTD